MNYRSFFLRPLPSASPLPDLRRITGTIARHSNTLAIEYALLGQMEGLEIPEPDGMPVRKRGLWKETCLEFFLAAEKSNRYWEFNLSPAGHWNVYRFAGYRRGMQEEMAYTTLSFRVQKQSDSLLLALEVDLDKIVQAGQPLDVAISAVIKPNQGEMTYWALTHLGPQADFHRRDSFIIEL